MILIADSGSTKVDWRLLDKEKQVLQFSTRGINPYFRSTEDIIEELKQTLCPAVGNQVPGEIWFYGAGCTHAAVNEIVRKALTCSFNSPRVEVASDLLGAARGLCGYSEGVACILGTGSNSCYYNGKEIVENVSPLGYILGDEGSGAVLGKLFVGACLKNQLTAGIKEEFLESLDLTPAGILEKVYKQPLPNRFLASFSPFIRKHLQDPSVRTLVENAFRDFFVKNVLQYKCAGLPVHLTGSVAFHYQEIIQQVAQSFHLRIETITSSPVEGLIRYHKEKEN